MGIMVYTTVSEGFTSADLCLRRNRDTLEATVGNAAVFGESFLGRRSVCVRLHSTVWVAATVPEEVKVEVEVKVAVLVVAMVAVEVEVAVMMPEEVEAVIRASVLVWCW